MTETKYLAVDFGLKRTGVAVSDSSKTFAFSRETLQTGNDLYKKILNLIKDENVEKVIVGYPLRFDSSETHSTSHVEKFTTKLKNLIKQNSLTCEVVFFDERFTSNIAKYHLANSGMKSSKRKDKGNIDAISAQIILQDFLDKEKNISKI